MAPGLLTSVTTVSAPLIVHSIWKGWARTGSKSRDSAGWAGLAAQPNSGLGVWKFPVGFQWWELGLDASQ